MGFFGDSPDSASASPENDNINKRCALSSDAGRHIGRPLRCEMSCHGLSGASQGYDYKWITRTSRVMTNSKNGLMRQPPWVGPYVVMSCSGLSGASQGYDYKWITRTSRVMTNSKNGLMRQPPEVGPYVVRCHATACPGHLRVFFVASCEMISYFSGSQAFREAEKALSASEADISNSAR
jgi:hypothetical protein